MASTHTHPHPLTDRLAQYGGIVLTVIMIAGAVGQIVLATAGFPLFLLSGIVTLVLIAPVMLLTSATPAVSVAPEGITLQPRVWRERFVRWDAIRAVKDYPLLPPKDVEVGRRTMVGKRRYRPAEGKMLIIPSLPLYYRFTGLFVGEGFTGVVAVTNRSHTDYARLIAQVEKYTKERTED
ncbi:MAG: hypothetical protein GC204_20415 [Chloroflexi bacterium]|nr:hypothetical protein [Chloroflexota bacterium]